MKHLKAFLQLIRWPNLVFIVIAQGLFQWAVILPVYEHAQVPANLAGANLWWLMLASVCIAAAGNIINDYFDLNIDQVNKPEKVVIDKYVRRRWAIIWHLILSGFGIGISFYLDTSSSIALLGWANTMCVVLLFVYSITLKKKLLIGNVVISLLTAWVILVVPFAESSQLLRQSALDVQKITRLSLLYGAFAFIISLIREVVKDIEDVEGDRRYGCKTMPIVWGIQVSKIFTATWLMILIVTLLAVQLYVLTFGWWLSALYCVVAIILPCVQSLMQLKRATSPNDFHALSSRIKLVMLTGIVSMMFFRWYVSDALFM
ncbi:MAG: geranylgeranylglycerol-phosphate geranylgeranyltransferase [Chitinophagaceae bacterium]